jgi:hypothetical protein
MMLLTAILISSHLVSAKSAATSKDRCASLRNGVDHIVDANSVVAGALQLESMTGVNNVTFCRVRGLMPYGGNNTLNYEVWLPEKSKYNRRYLSVGQFVWSLMMLMGLTRMKEMVVLQEKSTTLRCFKI